LYDKGRGVSQDYKEAVKWYRVAADQGSARAQVNLGVMYSCGRGVALNLVAAYALYNISAKNDSVGNLAARNRAGIAKDMKPEEIEAGVALANEIGLPGNLLKALDQYLSREGN